MITSIPEFLSTPSGWRATMLPHLPQLVHGDFYPRPPGGGRPIDVSVTNPLFRFLSTPSGWRATLRGVYVPILDKISIHALRVEGDRSRATRAGGRIIFLSTPSGWRATTCSIRTRRARTTFLSTPSGWRATAKTDKVFICFCAKGRRICLFKTRKEKNLPMAF